MSDPMRRAEALFEKKAPEPEPEPGPERRRRLVRDRSSLAPVPSPRLSEEQDEALDRQARALKDRLLATRRELGVGSRPVVRPAAPAPVAAPAEPARPALHWLLTVVGPGDQERSFLLVAADVVEATRTGARAIAAWMRDHHPGGDWRVRSVERLANVL